MQLTLFSDDVSRRESEAHRAGMALDGPHAAIMVARDGACAKVGALIVR